MSKDLNGSQLYQVENQTLRPSHPQDLFPGAFSTHSRKIARPPTEREDSQEVQGLSHVSRDHCSFIVSNTAVNFRLSPSRPQYILRASFARHVVYSRAPETCLARRYAPNPFDHNLGDDSTSSPCPELQEMLVAPYRAHLSGFCRFQFKGEINKDIRKAAILNITRPLDKNPDAILRQLEAQKSRGDQHFKDKDVYRAIELWEKALRKIKVLAGVGDAANGIFDIGGQTFVNRIAELTFVLFSNKIQAYLNIMWERDRDEEVRDHISDGLFLALREAMGAIKMFESTTWVTWQPSNRQMGDIFYRSARAFALVGGFEEALGAIERASLMLPGDPVIEAERDTLLRFI